MHCSPASPLSQASFVSSLNALCSATNYCGTANNAGAILVLGRDLVGWLGEGWGR